MAILAVTAIVIFAGAKLRADTYPRQAGIDARHYAVRSTGTG
jgi:hypothetical protein